MGGACDRGRSGRSRRRWDRWGLRHPRPSFRARDGEGEPRESVTFVNDGGTHNVKFEDEQFTSPAMPSPPESWPSPAAKRTFPQAGTYRFYCQMHGGPGRLGDVGAGDRRERGRARNARDAGNARDGLSDQLSKRSQDRVALVARPPLLQSRGAALPASRGTARDRPVEAGPRHGNPLPPPTHGSAAGPGVRNARIRHRRGRRPAASVHEHAIRTPAHQWPLRPHDQGGAEHTRAPVRSRLLTLPRRSLAPAPTAVRELDRIDRRG